MTTTATPLDRGGELRRLSDTLLRLFGKGVTIEDVALRLLLAARVRPFASGDDVVDAAKIGAIVRREEDPDPMPAWAARFTRTRNLTGPGLVALCQSVVDDEECPDSLRELARRFLRDGSLQRADHVAARATDPETSKVAAERIRPLVRRPGGTVHRILRGYRLATAIRHGGMTAAEIERHTSVKAAHKRTSELLRDGLLEVVQTHGVDTAGHGEAIVDVSVDLVRDGGRVLRITDAGREELARLDALERQA